MFESIVQSLLERHLGRFVKDLGKHDLKIGLLKGIVATFNRTLRAFSRVLYPLSNFVCFYLKYLYGPR